MIELGENLTAQQRIILANDTSSLHIAHEQAELASGAGAALIKMGLEVSSSEEINWAGCSNIADSYDLDWVADAKIPDIPNTSVGLLKNILDTAKPPVAVTITAAAGYDTMRALQDVAEEHNVLLLGVTALTSILEAEIRADQLMIAKKLLPFLRCRREDDEWVSLDLSDFSLGTLEINAKPEDSVARRALVESRAVNAAAAGIGGLVASPRELLNPIKLNPLTQHKFTMIPGTRSAGAASHDQVNVETPRQAIIDGADLLVIGRQVTKSEDPAAEFARVVTEIQEGLDERATVA